jgi:hypothetical protein
MCRQFTRKPRLSEFFEALKIIDMAVIDLLAKKGSLTIDGRRVGDIVLTKNPGISLGEVLRPLDLGVNFVNFLAQLLSNSVDRGGIEVSRVTECVPEDV